MKLKFLKKKNIANIISSLRLLFVPLLVLSGIKINKKMFIISISLNTLFDCIDGFIARKLKIQSEFGRRLDALVDFIVIMSSIIMFIIMLRSDIIPFITNHYLILLLPLTTYATLQILAYIFLHRFSSLHLYTSKFAQLPLIIFFINSLFNKFNPIILSVAVITFTLSNIEGIIIYCIKKQKTNEEILSIFEMLR